MFGDCDNCGHSIIYHALAVGCLKCSCGEFSCSPGRLGRACFIGCAVISLVACHQHHHDEDVPAKATKFSEHVWPGIVKQITCGPCPCREGQDACDEHDNATCMVVTAKGEEPQQLHVITCPVLYNIPCNISESWEETHKK